MRTLPLISTMTEQYLRSPAKRRRLSLSPEGYATSNPLFDGLPGVNDIRQHDDAATRGEKTQEDTSITISSISKLAGQRVAPFLAQHIPEQYAPLGGSGIRDGIPIADPNTKYCYRHQPDRKCRRQADEPSMDQLQHVSSSLPTFLPKYC